MRGTTHLVVLVLLLQALELLCADLKPFTVEEQQALQKISPGSVSPDGKFAAYGIRQWVSLTLKN
jgi:hypothetical protein